MLKRPRHNPLGKVFSKAELEAIAALCVKRNIIILSDEVYDRLYYVPFTRVATLSPEISRLTMTVGSAGKNFYATGWRVGWLIGPEHLIKHVSTAHTRICYCTVSPLQEAAAVGFEQADQYGFWEESKRDMKGKLERFNAVWRELGLPYSDPEGGYFVMVNMSKVKLPDDYVFPPHVADRPRDFKLCWFLIMELGVAAIPPTGMCTYTSSLTEISLAEAHSDLCSFGSNRILYPRQSTHRRELPALCILQKRRRLGDSKGEAEGLEEVYAVDLLPNF